MAGTVISAHYPPHIDVTRAPIAYGDRALPRMNCELKASELITRQRALMSLSDYLRDPEHIATAIKQGTVFLLTRLLFDQDTTVRMKTAECLNSFASHAIGRDAFITYKVIAPLSTLFGDPKDIVRRNAHLTMSRVAQTPVGAMEIVDQQIIPMLVAKLHSEGEEILDLILETLHHCFKVDVQSALDNNCMSALTELLQHSQASVRAGAARCIMGLTSTLPGKDQAIEDRCVPELVTLLEDDEASVKANAAGALMRIVITTRGKYAALEAGALPRLVKIVQNENSEVRLNTLKAITSLSDAPEGRAYLLEHELLFRDTCSDPVAAVAAAAKKALDVILWLP